jgi:hypothetical protein
VCLGADHDEIDYPLILTSPDFIWPEPGRLVLLTEAKLSHSYSVMWRCDLPPSTVPSPAEWGQGFL